MSRGLEARLKKLESRTMSWQARLARMSDEELNAAYIVPSVFHADVHHAVAAAVRRAAGGPHELPSDTEVAV